MQKYVQNETPTVKQILILICYFLRTSTKKYANDVKSQPG